MGLAGYIFQTYVMYVYPISEPISISSFTWDFSIESQDINSFIQNHVVAEITFRPIYRLYCLLRSSYTENCY